MSGFHFICYSRHDGGEFAERLEAGLAARTPRISTWRDVGEIIPGTNWTEEVGDALRDCDSLLFIMTSDSFRNSSICVREFNWVESHYRKPIIPIRFHREAGNFLIDVTQEIRFDGDFDRLIVSVGAAIDALFSPKGRLKQSRNQLIGAERDLRLTTPEDPTRPRLVEEIRRLNVQVMELKKVVDDPGAADLAVRQRIELGLEQEREMLSRAAFTPRGCVINRPPLEVPAHFKGRTEEGERLARWIRHSACSVVTLHGRSGAGKTTLVCRILRVMEQERDSAGGSACTGIIYLGSNTRAITFANLFEDLCRLLRPETAAALDKRFRDSKLGTAAKTEALLAELRTGRVIVFLDGFEDLLSRDTFEMIDLDMLPFFQTVLKDTLHRMTVIITSNYLPSDLLKIPYGHQEQWELTRGISNSEAAELLRELDADGHLGLRQADAKLLEEAWQRTGGNPRALEHIARLLAANPDNTLSELLEQLPEDLSTVLAGETFATLDRLSQAAMQAMSVCSTSVFPRVSATAVDFLLQPYFPGVNAKTVLGRLVRMYLARRDPAGGGYYLDNVDATYTRSHVTRGDPADRAPGDVDPPPFTQIALLHRAIDYYLKLVKPKEQCRRKEDFDPQMAAFQLYVEAGEYQLASTLLGQFDHPRLTGWGQDRLVADSREQLEGHLQELRFQRYNAAILGICYSNMGFFVKSIAFHERALKLAREQPNEAAEIIELSFIGTCMYETGKIGKAIELHLQALDGHRRKEGSRAAEGTDLTNLGCCYADLGDARRAIEFHSQAIEIARELNDPAREANRLANLALAMVDAGETEEALFSASEAAQLASMSDRPYFRVQAMHALALTALVVNDLPGARAAIEAARADDVHMSNHIVGTLFGIIALRQGENEVAARAFRAAAGQADALLQRTALLPGALDTRGVALAGLAVLEEENALTEAKSSFRRARRVCGEPGVVLHVRQLLDAMAPADARGVLSTLRDSAMGNEPSVSRHAQ